MASALVESLMGPGFESQVPQYICFIFLQIIACGSQGVAHHTPQRSRRQMASRPNLKARIEGSPYSPVNAYAWNGESQSRLERKWAKQLQISPPLGPNTPLVYFLFIIFIYLLYCFKLIIFIKLTN